MWIYQAEKTLYHISIQIKHNLIKNQSLTRLILTCFVAPFLYIANGAPGANIKSNFLYSWILSVCDAETNLLTVSELWVCSVLLKDLIRTRSGFCWPQKQVIKPTKLKMKSVLKNCSDTKTCLLKRSQLINKILPVWLMSSITAAGWWEMHAGIHHWNVGVRTEHRLREVFEDQTCGCWMVKDQEESSSWWRLRSPGETWSKPF